MTENKELLLKALEHISPADLSYQEWINIGMALSTEGLDCSVWDGWSRNDSRYKQGECQKKWKTFHGSGTPITGGTIVQMAKEHGFEPKSIKVMGWDDEIQNDGSDFNAHTAPVEWDPVQELMTYLEIIFHPDDRVSLVTNDVWESDGKWCPGRGDYSRTRDELLKSLKKHRKDLGATVGDWKKEAGAWIRFNPVDGNGVKNENVTAFRYALVESDTMSISDQDAMLRKLELPIATMVFSGGKSIHAIVHVDAENYEEYRKRVEFLYDFLEKHGMTIDKQNRNPSRMTRLPGATRNGERQYLVATNIGRKSWDDWMDYVEGVSDEMPKLVSLSEYKDNPPELPEELIKGILRRGHKMLLSGSSKAGKSFLLMELCICIAEGKPWLGFDCKRGKVLYVNLEIDPDSAINRFLKIYEAMGIPMEHTEDIVIWNLRGHAVPLDQLVPKLIRRIKDQTFVAIVIDPIYKVITGDENNASEMGAFCNQFDKICTETGCSTIYCHHHSKGAQGSKRAMDRASGSGVFARDPDAQLDMIELVLTEELKNYVRDGYSTAWRLESSLREFPNIKPVNFWFEYPVHRLDTSGELEKANAEGSPQANLEKSSKRTTPEQRKSKLDSAYNICSAFPPVKIKDLAGYMECDTKTVRRYLDEFDEDYWVENGVVGLKVKTDKGENPPMP